MDGGDKKKIFYGSIQANKITTNNSTTKRDQPEQPQPTFLPFSKLAQESQQRQQSQHDEYERKKKAKQIVVPTNDGSVRLKLRELGEPITLFGEKPEDRRARLRQLCIDRNIIDATPEAEKQRQEQQQDEADQQEAFLTEGTDELKNAREAIAIYSMGRAKLRLSALKQQHEQDDIIVKANSEQLNPDLLQKTPSEQLLEQVETDLRSFVLAISEIGDDRQLSSVAFSPDAKLVATASWSGLAKLWDADTAQVQQTFTGHSERVVGLAYYPLSDQSATGVTLATASADGTAALWSSQSPSPIAKLEGHAGSVNRVAFHPMGRHLLSTGIDRSWRLWDIESNQCLLDQEGHSEPVMGIAVQCDGALVATGAQDALVRVWDLRSGRPIHYFRGHAKQVISVDWSPNGYQLASGSEDNTVIVWDLRKKEQTYQILAHSSIVSCVRYDKSRAGFLATCSFDNTVRLWSPNQWKPITVFEGHSSKVTSVDISNDHSKIVSTSFDKTWKIWSK
ncbi:hypothetical protein SAMD00019534_113960 [Acytostelium subglobosum LB1]|uniref:hypothetical protein n=1 Tax=Acytostelium subglobosum LB1 TaxID=1410327 RepID=UPI000644C100|nr:hypothetical protein SAMD00019534_113960 [Acytostelium subglobosum LB1]GAM28220.1 hypothetical protein SAMD00019534_113960 [Acytostelium subglobosum LB1]|eukprot:XP_012748854.1 hypothetical protein SAMD00019534_113960 [Acytostelium subglobosum LB1]